VQYYDFICENELKIQTLLFGNKREGEEERGRKERRR
tara:strand:+ start:398 stop:508 length:111 start_codon:yes stop_codon:yes gene_type:complete